MYIGMKKSLDIIRHILTTWLRDLVSLSFSSEKNLETNIQPMHLVWLYLEQSIPLGKGTSISAHNEIGKNNIDFLSKKVEFDMVDLDITSPKDIFDFV